MHRVRDLRKIYIYTINTALKKFLVLEDNKLSKAKFFIKPKEALALETLLIFNGYILT